MWYEHLREIKRLVYRLDLNQGDTYDAAGVVSINMVSSSDILEVFGEVSTLVERTLKRGLFCSSKTGEALFRRKKKEYCFKAKASYSTDLDTELHGVSMDALYSDYNDYNGECGESISQRFITSRDRLRLLSDVTIKEVNSLFSRIFSRPLVVMLGNTQASISKRDFEKRAEKATASFLQTVNKWAAIDDKENNLDRYDKKKESLSIKTVSAEFSSAYAIK
jgi:hypothetical protein